MTPLFADVAPTFTSGEFYAVCGVLAFLLATALTIKLLVKRDPPMHQEFASREEHAELKSRVDKISDEIARGFERVDSRRSQSVAGLHDDLEESITALRLEVKTDIKGVQDRMSDVLGAVSRIEGKLEK